MTAESEENRIRYFADGTIILLIEHGERLEGELRGKLLGVLNPKRDNIDDNLRDVLGLLEELVDRDVIASVPILVFQSPDAERFREHVHRLRPSMPMYSPISLPTRDSGLRGRYLLRQIEKLNSAIQLDEFDRLSLDLGEGLTLRAVSPNWLLSQSGEVAGGGGPGARPQPAPELFLADQAVNIQTGDVSHTPFGFTFSDPDIYVPLQTCKQQVDVVILDTIPHGAEGETSEQAVASVVHRLQQRGSEHPLLSSLSNVLKIIDPAKNIRDPLKDIKVQGHEYDMSSHGLFVAGIIHTIAPHARLHLIKVLNDNGVGDLNTIIQVIYMLVSNILGNDKERKIIINCSFTMVMPLPGHPTNSPEVLHGYEDDLDVATSIIGRSNALAGKKYTELDLDEQNILDRLELLQSAFNWVCASLPAENVMIVAAAGNDAHARVTDSRPPARSPAAFPTVVGAGALDRNGDTTAYSNKADWQAEEGLATFGGQISPKIVLQFDSTNGNEAVYGAYIGTFPDGQENETSWAWWAGTSFAAPVISGLLAHLMCTHENLSLVGAYALLMNVKDGATGENDQILKAWQGKGATTDRDETTKP